MKGYIFSLLFGVVTYFNLSELSDIRLLFSVIVFSIVHNEMRLAKLEKVKK